MMQAISDTTYFACCLKYFDCLSLTPFAGTTLRWGVLHYYTCVYYVSIQ